MRTARFLQILLLATSSVVAEVRAQVLSPHGYGAVTFGAKLSEVESKLRERASSPPVDPWCSYVQFSRYPEIGFMVEQGVITRADAAPNIENSAKVRIGMSIGEVLRLHPAVEVGPHKYDDDGHYLTIKTSDGRAALIFEESKGKVTSVRAGLFPAVGYVERCL